MENGHWSAKSVIIGAVALGFSAFAVGFAVHMGAFAVHESERQEWKNERTQLRSQIAKLKTELLEKASAVRSSQDQTTVSQGRLFDLEEELNRIKQQNSKLQQENKALVAGSKRTREKGGRLELENSKCTKENKRLKERNTGLAEDIKQLRAASEKAEEDRNRLAQENTRLTEINRKLKEENKRLLQASRTDLPVPQPEDEPLLTDGSAEGGTIAVGQQKKFFFVGRKNKAVLIRLEAGKNVGFGVRISAFDPKQREIKNANKYITYRETVEVPITPQLDGKYEIRLEGSRHYGQFKLNFSEL